MLFTFGRYAGYRLAEIPTPYLKRAVTFRRIGITLRDGIRMELARRLAIEYGHAVEEPSPAGKVQQAKIRQAFGLLCRSAHQPKSTPAHE